MTLKYKILSAIRIHSGCVLRITELNGGVVAFSTTITPGLYYPSGDGTATDLLLAMKVTAIPVDAFVAWIVDGDGIIAAEATIRGANVSLSLDLTDAPDLWSACRLPNGTVSQYKNQFIKAALLPWTGTYCHLGGWYPSESYLQQDLRSHRPLATQYRPDAGNAQTVWVATRADYSLRLRASGYPRPTAGGYTEYHDLLAWYDHAITGVPSRLYPDTTITTAYSASNRLGFETMSVVPNDVEPAPLNPNIYKHWDMSVSGLQYTE